MKKRKGEREKKDGWILVTRHKYVTRVKSVSVARPISYTRIQADGLGSLTWKASSDLLREKVN